MKKILIVSTVSRQFFLFENGNIEVLKSLGYEIHAAANYSDANERLDNLDIIRRHFDIQRSPFSFKNIKAYIQLKKIMKSEKFDAIHCHSPMGGVLARLAAKSVGIKPIIYTAHGFHFYKGAPIKNWLLYYSIEYWLARYTDVIITINQEDYERANKSFKARNIEYVPGVGIDIRKKDCINIDIQQKRKDIGLPEDSFVLLSVGELNENKNHESVIKAIAKLKNPNVFYVICGKGSLQNYLTKLINELELDKQVKLLGYRKDIVEICKIVDAFIFPSFREGLSVALMEAMSTGLPIICSKIRGNTDLIDEGKGGYLVIPNDIEGYLKTINKLIKNEELRKEMGIYNLECIKQYDVKKVKDKMKEIYKKISQ